MLASLDSIKSPVSSTTNARVFYFWMFPHPLAMSSQYALVEIYNILPCSLWSLASCVQDQLVKRLSAEAILASAICEETSKKPRESEQRCIWRSHLHSLDTLQVIHAIKTPNHPCLMWVSGESLVPLSSIVFCSSLDMETLIIGQFLLDPMGL